MSGRPRCWEIRATAHVATCPHHSLFSSSVALFSSSTDLLLSSGLLTPTASGESTHGEEGICQRGMAGLLGL